MKKILAIVLLFPMSSIFSQIMSDLHSNDTLQFDPLVRMDTLENGFTYYILSNKSARGKADIFFDVKAGFNQQRHDQLQIAHVLEHLSISSTKHFSNGWSFFRNKGLKLGDEINAFTSADHTCYYLRNVSIKNKNLIDSALLFMHDLAHDIKIDSIAIERERRIVLNEVQRSATSMFMRDYYWDQIISNPGYVWQTSKDHIRNLNAFKHSSLLKFYNDWYWADNQAIFIVGDVDADSLEQKIKKQFSDLKRSKYPPRKITYAPFQWKDQIIKVTDPEMEDVEIRLFVKHPFRFRKTKDDYIFFLKAFIFNVMANCRLEEVRKELTFLIGTSLGNYDNFFNVEGPSFAAFSAVLKVKDTQIESNFKAWLTELERIRRFGFSPDEFETAITKFRNAELSDENIFSNYAIVRKYISHFVYGQIYGGYAIEKELMGQFLAEITLKDMNQFVKQIINGATTDIVILAPEQLRPAILDVDTIKVWLQEIQNTDLQPLSGNTFNPEKIDHIIAKRDMLDLSDEVSYEMEEITSIGVTKLNISNGVKFFLKPLKRNVSESGKIYIKGFSPGGADVYADSIRPFALYASEVTMNSGLASFSMQELDAFKRQRELVLHLNIANDGEYVWGRVMTSNVESLFQLLFLYFKDPKINKNAYLELVRRLNSSMRTSDRAAVVSDSVLNLMGIEVPSKSMLRDTSRFGLDWMHRIFNECFRNTGDFTFAIAGDFELNSTIPLVVKYFGALPPNSGQGAFVQKVKKIRTFDAEKKIFARKSFEPAGVIFYLAGNYKANFKKDLQLDQLSCALKLALRKRLRDIEGATYDVEVRIHKIKDADTYYFRIQFECAFDKAEHLALLAKEEINRLSKCGVDSSILELIKIDESKRLEEEQLSSQFWLNYLIEQGQKEETEIDAIRSAQLLVDKLKPHDVKKLARSYLLKASFFQLFILPRPLVLPSIEK